MNLPTDFLDDLHSEILPNSVVVKLNTEAQSYFATLQIKDKKEWHFGRLVFNLYKFSSKDFKEEVSLEIFCAECERVMNDSLPYPLFPESGSKLRRWVNMWQFYKDKEIKPYKLSYNHFFIAKRLDFNGIVSWEDALKWANGDNLDKEKKSAEDMEFHFNPKEPVTVKDKVTKWLNELPEIEWKSKADKTEVFELKDKIKVILERNVK